MWGAVQRDAEKTPFTSYSVAAFWLILVTLLGAVGWAYPRIADASTLKEEFTQFRVEVKVDRLREQLDDKKKEISSLEREIERIRLSAPPVPNIYYTQRDQLVNERDNLSARINAILRNNAALAVRDQ
jgi:hypothetical protein